MVMKKSALLVLITLFTVSFVFAQEKDAGDEFKGFSKNDIILTGSVSYGNTKSGDNKMNRFSVNPKLGYFITNNLMLGVEVGFTTDKRNQQQVYNFSQGTGFSSRVYNAEVKSTIISPTVFGRYYFNPEKKFSFFSGLAFSYLNIKNSSENSNLVFSSQLNPNVNSNSSSINQNGFLASFIPGVNYFLSNKFSLEANIGILSYSSIKADYQDAKALNTFNIGLNLSNVNLGLVYRF